MGLSGRQKSHRLQVGQTANCKLFVMPSSRNSGLTVDYLVHSFVVWFIFLTVKTKILWCTLWKVVAYVSSFCVQSILAFRFLINSYAVPHQSQCLSERYVLEYRTESGFVTSTFKYKGYLNVALFSSFSLY